MTLLLVLSDFAFEFDFADGLPFFEFENPEVDAISVPALRVFFTASLGFLSKGNDISKPCDGLYS